MTHTRAWVFPECDLQIGPHSGARVPYVPARVLGVGRRV